VNLQQGFFSVF